MQFTIEVIDVTEEKGKRNARGGVFNALNVAYRKDGKVEAKSFPDWANKDIYPVLQALNKGDVRVVTTEKVNGFWQWLAVGDGNEVVANPAGSAPAASSSSGEAAGRASIGRVTGSNYETKDERALRQRLIVAQSCLAQAVTFVAAQNPKGGDGIVADAVLERANQFYDWAWATANTNFSDLQDDIPQ